jgi:hypothetical protein
MSCRTEGKTGGGLKADQRKAMVRLTGALAGSDEVFDYLMRQSRATSGVLTALEVL